MKSFPRFQESGEGKQINKIVGSLLDSYEVTVNSNHYLRAIYYARTEDCSAPGVLFIPLNSTASPSPSRANFISEDLGTSVGTYVTDIHCMFVQNRVHSDTDHETQGPSDSAYLSVHYSGDLFIISLNKSHSLASDRCQKAEP